MQMNVPNAAGPSVAYAQRIRAYGKTDPSAGFKRMHNPAADVIDFTKGTINGKRVKGVNLAEELIKSIRSGGGRNYGSIEYKVITGEPKKPNERMDAQNPGITGLGYSGWG